jgi:thiamine-monophosphate kinase
VAAARLPSEFDLIARYFAPLAAGRAGAAGLIDDAAFLEIDPAMELVVTADATVGEVHFLSQDPPALIARKALRVNLSDLAAKGARPLAYFMTVALPPELDEPWIAAFCSGLAADQAEFGIALMGGDTTSTPGPLTLSITALGLVPRGLALKRSAARAGDAVLVSGTLGDAALGLMALREGLATLPPDEERRQLVDRYRLPRPRCALGPLLAESRLVHAAMDVSDGLVADLGHVCKASGVGAEIETARLPLSTAAAAALEREPALMTRVLAGGDDYEILFTAPAENLDAIAGIARRLDLPLTVIGRMTSGEGVRVIGADGADVALESAGFRHF